MRRCDKKASNFASSKALFFRIRFLDVPEGYRKTYAINHKNLSMFTMYARLSHEKNYLHTLWSYANHTLGKDSEKNLKKLKSHTLLHLQAICHWPQSYVTSLFKTIIYKIDWGSCRVDICMSQDLHCLQNNVKSTWLGRASEISKVKLLSFKWVIP